MTSGIFPHQQMYAKDAIFEQRLSPEDKRLLKNMGIAVRLFKSFSSAAAAPSQHPHDDPSGQLPMMHERTALIVKTQRLRVVNLQFPAKNPGDPAGWFWSRGSHSGSVFASLVALMSCSLRSVYAGTTTIP